MSAPSRWTSPSTSTGQMIAATRGDPVKFTGVIRARCWFPYRGFTTGHDTRLARITASTPVPATARGRLLGHRELLPSERIRRLGAGDEQLLWSRRFVRCTDHLCVGTIFRIVPSSL
ncbi:hypothetical protein [Sorangium sp. So ce1335]|uniref:hypothetical protein n=1 Tax=Sorangium sp. So ce1335 TaxID=3133335 RepID=UPI003F61AB7F